MPIARPISLNNVAFTPSDIKETEDRIGTSFQAVNGSRRFALRATKRTWSLEWAKVLLATVDQLRAIYRLTVPFTYVAESGEMATVYCDTDALQITRSFISGDNTVYYQVTLVIKES